MATYRVKCVLDQDARFEECNGEPRPLTKQEYADNPYHDALGCLISYGYYLAYYGDPDRHVYVGIVIERRCECCARYAPFESLWGIDLMDDAPEWVHVRLDTWYSVAEFDASFGCLLDCVNDMLPIEDRIHD